MADQSIFGVTDPELIKQAIAAQQEQGMLAKAKLSPDELMRYSAMAGSERAVQGLGGLVGGIFGVDVIDPRVKKAQMAQGIINEVNASGLDPNSPDYFAQVARLAQQKGLPDLAQMAVGQAQAMQSKSSEIGLKTAQTMEALRKATSEGMVKTPAEFAAIAVELGFGSKPNINDYTDQQAKAVNAELLQRSILKQEAGVPKPTPTERVITPEKGKLRGEVEANALNSTKAIQTADALNSVIDRAFTGFGSDAKLRVGQVANALGVDVTGTSETEQLKQLLASLAQGQAKSLPGSLSEKELAFLREAIGTTGFTVNTLKNVIKRIRTDAIGSQLENDKVQAYIDQGGDLNRYNFVRARSEATQEAAKQVNDYFTKLNRLRELQAKQGVK